MLLSALHALFDQWFALSRPFLVCALPRNVGKNTMEQARDISTVVVIVEQDDSPRRMSGISGGLHAGGASHRLQHKRELLK